MARPVALVTGASAGIGMEFARIAAGAGHDLVLVARRVDVLERLGAELKQRHQVEYRTVAADLAAPDAVGRVVAALDAAGTPVDILVNNAGFGERGRFGDLPLGRQLDMIRVNILALTELTHRLLPQLVQRRGGILNVASTAAFQPGPEMSVYYATKAYVLHFTEGLHEEYAARGVRVTCLCPGPTQTEFAATASMEDALLFKLGAASARAVAESGWNALARGQAIAIPGLMNRATAFSARLAPRFAVRKVAHYLQARK